MNIFVTFLKLLKVKHTNDFSRKYYNEHPHKYNLYGLSSMLSDYGIENVGLSIDNKKDNLPLLEVPFIAHAGNDFVIVNNNTSEKIDYIWRNKNISVSFDEFIKSWSGVVLLAEPSATSGEPKYRANRQKYLFQSFGKHLLLILSCLCIGMLFFSQKLFNNWGLSMSFLINMTGIYVCYLLLLKQMKIQGSYADKICSLFKQKDCNDILKSESAKLWGIIGWSEIGFGYFISNTIILLFFPHLVTFLAAFNVCALPYTIWSIWYQKKVKQWCMLCLIVQCLLWVIFFVNLFANFLQVPLLSATSLFWIGSIYLCPLLCIVLLVSKLSENIQMEDIKQEINSIKANENVFLSLIKKQPHYLVNRNDSTILFGNPDSKICITVLTNPHCIPCAKLHMKLEQLLFDTRNKVCVQYLFASFSEKLESSSQFMIKVYLEYPDQALHIYNEWFNGGKFEKEKMFTKYNFSQVHHHQEHIMHKAWREKNKIIITPFILVNGYQLPEIYKIEDLRFFTELTNLN